MHLHAALKLNTTDTDIVWYHESSSDIFSATMQWKRLTFLTWVVQFDNAETHKEWWKHNKFAVFHEFFKAGNHNFLKLQKPSPHMATNEIIYSYHRRISYKQYNLSKPAKYDLLLLPIEVCMIQWSTSPMYHFHMLGSWQVHQTSTT